jgi:hypothetical protein
LTLAATVLPAASAQDAREEILRERQLARAAHQAKDYAAFLAHSRRLQELAPRSATALYNLAGAEALLGHDAEVASCLNAWP